MEWRWGGGELRLRSTGWFATATSPQQRFAHRDLGLGNWVIVIFIWCRHFALETCRFDKGCDNPKIKGCIHGWICECLDCDLALGWICECLVCDLTLGFVFVCSSL